ncbi:hypothetical protein ACFQX6_00855 [Streptosporangium lutulentum]
MPILMYHSVSGCPVTRRDHRRRARGLRGPAADPSGADDLMHDGDSAPPTPATAGSPRTGLMDRLRADLRDPLFLQGYALMINTAITAVLGLGYWVLATRLYSASAFGEGQTTISVLRLFASLTGLAFVGALARFIPVAGWRTAEFVVRGYVIAGVAGLVAALGFLLTLPSGDRSTATSAGSARGCSSWSRSWSGRSSPFRT